MQTGPRQRSMPFHAAVCPKPSVPAKRARQRNPPRWSVPQTRHPRPRPGTLPQSPPRSYRQATLRPFQLRGQQQASRPPSRPEPLIPRWRLPPPRPRCLLVTAKRQSAPPHSPTSATPSPRSLSARAPPSRPSALGAEPHSPLPLRRRQRQSRRQLRRRHAWWRRVLLRSGRALA